MKTPKSTFALLALAAIVSGCSTSDANGVNISRPGMFNFLWSAPAPVPASPLTPPNLDNVPPSSPLAVN